MTEEKNTTKIIDKASKSDTSTKKQVKTLQKAATSVAKAGKRSAKVIAEEEKMQAKTERLAKLKKTIDKDEKNKKPKQRFKPPRSKLERRSRSYRKASELIDNDKLYSVQEAVELVVNTATTKFDSSVELHINLNVDPKLPDQNVRGTVVLPAGTGKKIKVAVLTEESAVNLKKVGADVVGNEDLLSQINKEKLNFDILITSPQMMAKLAKYARVLGPRGLMPNPKSGTVAVNLTQAVEQAKAGKIEFRVDSTGIIHMSIGKVSFGAEKLNTNVATVLSAVKSAKPASVRGAYIRAVYVTTTMGPSIKVTIA